MATKRVRVNIAGRVQGVFYRASTYDMALSLGLKGWVRNNIDGTVEALFQGSEDTVNKAVSWCREGPPSAFVTKVTAKEESPTDDITSFYVRY
jgi:acylphosphatase